MRSLGLLLLLTLSVSAAEQQTWQVAKSSSIVTVYTTLLPGKRYKSFKAVGTTPSTPEQVLTILDDVSNYAQWFAYTNSVRLLKSEQNKKYVYMETNFPWPLRNVDMVYGLSVSKNSRGDITLFLDGEPDYIPPVEGINRMQNAYGYILLQPAIEHTTISYVMHMTLNADIPPWLANKHIHRLPFETLNNLIHIAQQM